jgi:hypothetical protein
MNQQPFWLSWRKWIYAITAFAILIGINLLSRPGTSAEDPGGKLAKMRRDYNISEANLGKIDPASSTMQLATLGLNSVAQSMLWNMADEFKKKEDWTNLTLTLETLAKLNPNMISLWKFQSWNISYNVSVQFDNYRDRYYYVRRGIEYLEEGVDYNRENRDIPQLLWDLGWFIGQKVGRADEYVQYRELFKEDDLYHGDLPSGDDRRDNWLVSKEEFQNTIDAILNRGKSLGKKSEKIVYSSPGKSQMSYAEAIEEEGSFEKGQQAWGVAALDWREFGDQLIEHSTGRILRLGHEQELAERVKRLEEQLEQLAPGIREELYQEKLAALPAHQRAAVEKPQEERTIDENETAFAAQPALQVTDHDVYVRLVEREPEKRVEAGRILTQLAADRLDLTYTQRYKRDANFDYWQLRAEFEQTDTAVEARRKMFEAKQALENQDPVKAVELYDEGFVKWKEVLDTFPDLRDPDGTTGDDLMVYIDDYRRARKLLDEQTGPLIPHDFPLWDIIRDFDAEQEYTAELEEHERWLQEQGQASEAEPGDETREDQTPAEPSGTEPGGTPDGEQDAGRADPAEEATPPGESDGDVKSTEPEEAEPAETAPSSGEPESSERAAENSENADPTDESEAEPAELSGSVEEDPAAGPR